MKTHLTIMLSLLAFQPLANEAVTRSTGTSVNASKLIIPVCQEGEVVVVRNGRFACGGLPGLSDVKVYTSSGTWTKPDNLSYIEVEVWGAGAAGANCAGETSGAGGTSSFGSFLNAGGGQPPTSFTRGPGGTATGGKINISGGRGTFMAAYDESIANAGGMGGSSPRGGSGGPGGWSRNLSNSSGLAGNMPGGGGGSCGDRHSGRQLAGGGGGAYAYERISAAAITGPVTVTVGQGANGLSNSSGDGGDGADGMVVIREYR